MDAAERWQILRLHVEDQIPLAALARDTGVGLRTLERWHARYRTEGYTGLGTRRRADAGSHHLPSELVSLIEGLALSKPRPTIITIHRKISAICEEGGMAGALLWRGARDHRRPRPGHGHPCPGRADVVSRQVRTGAATAGRAPQCDVAGRPHDARHPRGGHRRQACPAMA